MFRLAVDARLMAGHPRGMGQFARALVASLDPANVIALLPAGRSTNDWTTRCEGMSFFPWWEQVVMPRLARDVGATHLLCPSNTGPIQKVCGLSTILVVHDLIYMEPIAKLPLSPSHYQNLGRLYRRETVPRALRHADHIVTVSNYTADCVKDLLPIGAERISVIPNSIDDAWFVDAPLQDSERGNYLLCVAGEAPSKNVNGLLHAFAQFRDRVPEAEAMELRIAGVSLRHHRKFLGLADALRITPFVRFMPPMDAGDLRDCFRFARAFVFPSLYEGFGIPLLEAMASGTPIACSDTTSLPEVAGDAPWYFDPRDTDSMARAMAAAIQSDERMIRAVRARARAEKYRAPVVRQDIEAFWKRVV